MGAGVIGVAAIWTLIKLSGPLIGGLASALAANKAPSVRRGAGSHRAGHSDHLVAACCR
jgi:uncharacterized oligopeptide transporter (OPT) family protein